MKLSNKMIAIFCSFGFLTGCAPKNTKSIDHSSKTAISSSQLPPSLTAGCWTFVGYTNEKYEPIEAAQTNPQKSARGICLMTNQTIAGLDGANYFTGTFSAQTLPTIGQPQSIALQITKSTEIADSDPKAQDLFIKALKEVSEARLIYDGHALILSTPSGQHLMFKHTTNLK